jgi:UDP-N-acetylglucosamine 1-carboxyvinyltransferase
MGTTFVINGGKKLKGEIETSAGKNAPVALLCASVMVRDKVVLKGMSHVEEVERMIEVLSSIGVECKWTGEHTLSIDSSKKLEMEKIDKKSCASTRISLLLLGALSAREKEYKLYKTGGCLLGQRTIRPHLHALEKFGVSVDIKNNYYDVKNAKLKANDVVMYESGDTATENAIMAAVFAPGKSTIKFASANYMVQDLCYFLNSAGAKIKGIGTTTLEITGVQKLHKVDSYYLIPDPVDAMAWVSVAITTKSPLTIKNCAYDFLALELENLSIMGQKFSLLNKRKSKSGNFTLVDIKIEPSDLKALPDKLHGRPYPGLNIDNVPLFVPILTQARGETLVHDWIYENRAIYYLELQKLGAKIMLLDTHRALVKGPSKLKANEVVCPPAIRPGMAILIAMLGAKGTSILRNAYPIERAYEDLIARLKNVGADISIKNN